MTKAHIGSGLSYGAVASPEHAKQAVKRALGAAGLKQAGSVLLFLTPAYAYEPEAALREAVKTAGTPQVFGCCSLGLLHQQEWVLDAEGAAAMVFPPELGLSPLAVLQRKGLAPDTVFTLSSPNAVQIALNDVDAAQYGAVVTDEYGHGPYTLWQSGNIVEREYSHTCFAKEISLCALRADGLEALSPPLQLNKAEHFDLQQIELMPATRSLFNYAGELQSSEHLLCMVSKSNDPDLLQSGDYDLHQVVGHNSSTGIVSLSGTVKAGRYLRWLRRNAKTAITELQAQLEKQVNQRATKPLFAILFSNVSRGPEFYDGDDQDLTLIQKALPDLPLIGFYSTAEICTTSTGHTRQFHHSALLMLAYSND